MKSHESPKRPAALGNRPVSRSSVAEEPIAHGSPLELFRQYGNWIALVLLLLPVLLCLLYVHIYSVNVAWEDQGDGLLPLFEKWDAGILQLGDFWTSHAEHHHFFPRLLMFGLGILSRWNTVLEMYVIQGMLLLTLAIFAYVLYRECRSDYAAWWLLPIPWLVLTWRQSQNLLFGWQIVYVMGSVTAVGALFFLYSLKTSAWLRAKFVAALTIASVSTFSMAQGLLLWPVGLVPLMLLPYSRGRRFTLAGIWAGVGIIEWIVYFWGYRRPPNHPPPGFSLEYFVVAVGGSLFPMALLATIAGIVILILAGLAFAIARTDRKWADYSFWLAAIIFGILIQLQVTVGRSGFGTGQAISSRYATYSVFIVLGVYGILSAHLAAKRSPFVAATWGVLLGLIVLGLPISYVEGKQAGEQMRQGMEYQAFVFTTSDTQPDEVVQMPAGPRAPEWRVGLKFLKEHHWNVYGSTELAERYAAPPDSTPVAPAAAKADFQYGMSKETGGFAVVGWAIDPTGNDVAGGVFLDIDGVLYPAFYGDPRDDIAAALKNPRLRSCGFRRFFSPKLFDRGPHRLTVRVLSKDRKSWFASAAPVPFNVAE